MRRFLELNGPADAPAGGPARVTAVAGCRRVRRRLAVVAAAVAFLPRHAARRPLADDGGSPSATPSPTCCAAQARGDAGAMLRQLDGCRADARCAATVRATRARCARPGRVEILAYDSGTAYALGASTGPTRVAWRVVGRGLPVVQCVERRARGGPCWPGARLPCARLSAPIGRGVPLLTRAPGTASRRRPRCSHPPHAPLTLPSAPRPAPSCAARSCPRRPPPPVRRATPSARTLYATARRAASCSTALALPPRPAGAGPAQRLAAPDRHGRLDARDRPERLERDGRVARPRSPAASAGTARTSACRARAAGLAWVVRFESVNYRARIWLNGQPIGTQHRRLPALRDHACRRRRCSAAGPTASSSASTAAAAPTDFPPAGLSSRARRSAAGGTTAGSCARSTCAGRRASTSTRSRAARTLPLRDLRRAVRLPRRACATYGRRPGASPSPARFGGRRVDARQRARSRPARAATFTGRCACPTRGCGRPSAPYLYDAPLTLSAGGRTVQRYALKTRHPLDQRRRRPAAAQRPAA